MSGMSGGFAARALVVERLFGHVVEAREEILLVDAVVADGLLDADLDLELVDCGDEVVELFRVVFCP